MPPKKRKVDRTELDSSYQWQVEDKPGSWLVFDSDTQQTLTSAFNDKEEQCEINGGEFIVMFAKPCRKTTKTGYQKRVRVAVLDKKMDNQMVTWSYADGRGKRHYYSVQSVIDLEANRKSNSLDVHSEGKACTVNVKEMKHSAKQEMYRELADAKAAVVDKTGADKPSTKAATSAASRSAVGKAAAGLKAKSQKAKAEPMEEKREKTVVKKGKAPVDPECPKANTAHVFYESGGDIWDCMLNQTNLQNNNNKYYLIQLLENDNDKNYCVWMRWGRVGKTGQTALFECGPDLQDAMDQFCKKFHDKTKNSWHCRKSFLKISGKYDLLEMDYDTGETEEDVVDSKPADLAVKEPESKLDKRLQDLINLISDVRAMEEAVVEMKYDAKKAPLGKLTKAQIKQGYVALKDIEALIKAEDFGFRLTEACNAFYTRIPHDFGMKPPEKITSIPLLKAKMSLLEALGDIEIAVNVLKAGDKSINSVDRHYNSLECQLTPMDKACDMYQLLNDYLLDTHASTHNQYSLELLDIFECDKDQGAPSTLDNKLLLWHGSRLTNWVGILAKGLRIAPPEAPVTGYMFGKGLYFADCSSKSANYCFPTRTNNVGLLLLNEVSLGNLNELLKSDYRADKLPKGKHSVKGCGKMAPDSSTHRVIDGVTVPHGKLKETGVVNPDGFTLQYNEYIVYNTNQVKMKYLLKVKFNFRY